MHVWVLGLSCETPAALGPPGLHTTTRELFTYTFDGPRRPHRETKRAKMGAGEGTKSAKFWPLPPFGATPAGPHLAGPHLFWVYPHTHSLFSSTPLLRAKLAQLPSTLSQQMEKPTFQLKPLGAAFRRQTTQKKQVSNIQRNIHKQFYNSLADTPTEQAILLSQSTSHTGAHLMQPSSEAYEVEDRCCRVSVARRLMLPHPAVALPADVVQFCPNKSAAGVICNKPLDPKQHHCYGCLCGGGVDRRHAALARCLADIIESHIGVKVFFEQKVPALTRVVNRQTEHARMDLVFNLNRSVTF